MIEVKRARRKEGEQYAARAKAESENKATEQEQVRRMAEEVYVIRERAEHARLRD